MKLWVVKVGKLDACIRPLFANSVTFIPSKRYTAPGTFRLQWNLCAVYGKSLEGENFCGFRGFMDNREAFTHNNFLKVLNYILVGLQPRMFYRKCFCF